MYRNHVGRWRPVHNEVGPFLADTIFAALHLIRPEGEGVRFAADSLVEEGRFDLSVPDMMGAVDLLPFAARAGRGPITPQFEQNPLSVMIACPAHRIRPRAGVC